MDRNYFRFKEFKEQAAIVWFRADDASDLARTMIYDFAKEPDVLTPLEKGKEWLFQDLKQFQPLTGNLLIDNGELFVGSAFPIRPPKREGMPPKGKLYLYLEVNGRLIQIGVPRPSLTNRRTDVDDLPCEIRRAYYNKDLMDGLLVPEGKVPRPSGRLLPIPLACAWPFTNRWAEWLHLTDRELERLVAVLNLEQDRDGNYYDLRSFLVHFPSDNSGFSESDVLFLHQKTSEILHMKNGDINSIRVLERYSEAIDRYCFHIISGNPDRFNFEEFTSPTKLFG